MKTGKNFTVRIVGPQVWDPILDNVDVEVVLEGGHRFGATFFTLRNIEKLFEKNRSTGECQSGLYLWASNMILVRQLSLDVINSTVESLLDAGELEIAFAQLSGSEAEP